MIVRRGNQYRTPRRDFGAFAHGAADAMNELPPDSAYEPLTLDDVRYFIGFALGVLIRRRSDRARTLDAQRWLYNRLTREARP